MHFDDGLDYLFGILEVDGTFHAFWSRDEAGEFSLVGSYAARSGRCATPGQPASRSPMRSITPSKARRSAVQA